ncbi:MAG: TonB-dependent receptor [Candidatus Cloacimonetes bacterium]|jgi:hypothetical protein|nr:TonB-dependent receptor [Candidatus Cloacimonadota bacterium]
MKFRHWLILALVLFGTLLGAQNTLQINGLNEAKFVYRTAADSLNAYFSDEFGFNLGYKNFNFGMKFISHLPKYPLEQTQLLQELDSSRLALEWKELYAGFEKDDFGVHVGTTEESFGRGLVFRSYKDLEFDEDHRMQSTLLRYDGKVKVKALYGAIANQNRTDRLDLAYGTDLEIPIIKGIRLGGSAMAFRDVNALGRYGNRDVFAGRLMMNKFNLEISGDYAYSQRYRYFDGDTDGHAAYVNAEYQLGDLLIGGAYKDYRDFNYRLNDIPLANYHGETLSDSSESGQDEQGWQARADYSLFDRLYLSADYAEAWNTGREKEMNDLYVAAEYVADSASFTLSWSHIEKLHKGHNWQKEFYPTLETDFSSWSFPLFLKAEFKTVESKQGNADVKRHFEPSLQAEFSLFDLGISMGVVSHWQEVSKLMESRYSPNIELKYPLFSHTDLLLFGGKEAGGKVCRNGVCRYVAPFEGIRAEVQTRF